MTGDIDSFNEAAYGALEDAGISRAQFADTLDAVEEFRNNIVTHAVAAFREGAAPAAVYASLLMPLAHVDHLTVASLVAADATKAAQEAYIQEEIHGA